MNNQETQGATNDVDRVVLRPSQIRELLIDTAICPYGWIRAGEPFFRIIGRLPQRVRDGLSQLKSEHIESDNWHLR
jgi:phage terminase Nu1 subunit (DNA packaging protein)